MLGAAATQATGVVEWRPDDSTRLGQDRLGLGRRQPIDARFTAISGAGVRAAALQTAAVRRWGVRARLADALGGAMPGGCTVLAGYVWTPPEWPGRQLRPDVAVLRERKDDLPPIGVPVLCVDIIDGARTDDVDLRDNLVPYASRPSERQQQAYASLGVDHYWQIDLTRRVVEVFLRDGVEFRHAETLTAAHEWSDFGIAVVALDVPTLLARRP